MTISCVMRRFEKMFRTFSLSFFAVFVTVTLLTACADNSPDRRAKNAAKAEALGLLAGSGRQDEALNKLLRLSRRGNVVAQREAGLALAFHRAGQQQEGVAWIAKAAKGGDAEAAFKLGEASQSGAFGLPPDHAAAAQYFEIAAARGHAQAALMIARMLKNGDGIARSDEQAGIWLKKSAECGNPQAMLLLSNAMANGDGFIQSNEQAVYWLEAAADKHYPPAIQALAQATESGLLGLKRDPQAVAELWKEAAEESRNHWKTQ